MALIGAGVGIGLLPRCPGGPPPRGLAPPGHPDARRTLSLVWLQDAYLSTAARDFRDLLRTAFTARELP
ncbi:LysR substrate-binding domain-containing protein [Streptomyces sp. M19]